MTSKENKKVRVLAIFKAPAPYIDPLLQLWATHPKVDLVVAYCVKTTDGETYYDPVTGKKVAWGTKLLGGGGTNICSLKIAWRQSEKVILRYLTAG